MHEVYDKYLTLEELNKKKMNRLNPFEDLNEGKQFAKKALYGTGRAIKTTAQVAYGTVKQIPSRVMAAKKRSGFGIHQFGKGENFGIGTKNFGVKINQANPLGYNPPVEKPKFKYRTRTKYITKYVYKKRR